MQFYPKKILIHDAVRRRWLEFSKPTRVIVARRLDEVIPALDKAEAIVNERGLYAVGFISYDAAPAFDSALKARRATSFPLAWFALCPRPRQPALSPAPAPGSYCAGQWRPDISRRAYRAAIDEIRRRIFAGDTYQVNYTFRMRSHFCGDPESLFLDLVRAQRSDFGAFIETREFAVCSSSPELFFRLEGDRLVSRPMKGTAPRGLLIEDDRRMGRWLRKSGKNRAENVMITDMVRNDMSRVAERDTVRVPELFSVERYPTLWQMTSTVECRTRAPVRRILEALFPCASITGAPKPMTTAIIRALEPTPRKLYTGAVGFIAPGRKAQFNVAIRTVVVDKRSGSAEYGVGGGVTWDSTGAGEYEECLVKARVLSLRMPEFSLLETMLWTPARGIFLLRRHMARLRDSAEYFGFKLDVRRVAAALAAAAAGWSCPKRVRLLVDRAGRHTLQASDYAPQARRAPPRVGLAKAPVRSDDPFLYHKTTRRDVYEQARASRPDCDDALLWNERGEITETTICNVALKINGVLYTPPVKCGLLPGAYRAMMLARGELKEKILSLEHARKAQAIYVMNSVRGMQRADVDF